MANKKIIILVSAVIIALLLIAAIVYFIYTGFIKKPVPVSQPKGEENSAKTIDYDKATQNPGEKIPETNPMNNLANPFETGYKNPFGE